MYAQHYSPFQARCELFSTTFNPEGIRTGNKILRQRLKGPALASYYPRKQITFREFQQEFKSLELEVEDEDEADRLEHIAGCVTVPWRSLHTPQPNKSQAENPWERSTQEEEGERSVLAPLSRSNPGVKLTATCRHWQEEISSLEDERCMRHELYHYCIEEGHNIPDMRLKSPEHLLCALVS